MGDREALDEANYLLPPSGREGDREAVEGASGHNSREYGLVAGAIRPYGEKVYYPHQSDCRKRGKRPILGRGGACSSRISGHLKTCGEVAKDH